MPHEGIQCQWMLGQIKKQDTEVVLFRVKCYSDAAGVDIAIARSGRVDHAQRKRKVHRTDVITTRLT